MDAKNYIPAVMYGADLTVNSDLTVVDDLTVTDDLTTTDLITTTITYGGTALTATAAEINQHCDESANVETVAATNVITASESGKTFFLSSATEFVSTLPAAAAGLRFSFIVAAAPSGASYTVITPGASGGANIILGHILSSQDAGGSGDSETSGGDTITFVDSKAVVGDRVDVICDGTNWFARGSSKVFDAITITTTA